MIWPSLIGKQLAYERLTRVILVANGMLTRGPICGRHVSLVVWFKSLSLAGVDPATSRQGKRLSKELSTSMPPCVAYYVYDPNCISI